MTRTPDVHFVAEARNNGTKLVVCSPDFSQVAKYADWWLPINAGQDGAFWMAVNHVILKEFHVDRESPLFHRLPQAHSAMPPFWWSWKNTAERIGQGGSCAPMPSDLTRTQSMVSGSSSSSTGYRANLACPRAASGFRWQEQKGQWNLEMKDGTDGSAIDPLLTLLDTRARRTPRGLYRIRGQKKLLPRQVPVRYVQTGKGRIAVTTVFDLLMAQHGVSRGLGRRISGRAMMTQDAPYTPAWQEQYTGIGRDTVVRFAREWAQNRREDERQMHGHCRLRHQPLVPCEHHLPDCVSRRSCSAAVWG